VVLKVVVFPVNIAFERKGRKIKAKWNTKLK
jgi:hypothetical protein